MTELTELTDNLYSFSAFLSADAAPVFRQYETEVTIAFWYCFFT